jgi:hypothetical protein
MCHDLVLNEENHGYQHGERERDGGEKNKGSDMSKT